MKNSPFLIIAVLLVVGLGAYAILSQPQPSPQPAPAPGVNQPQNLPVTTDTMNQSNTIVDVAVNSGNFTTLTSALQAAGLVETLNGPGPFTVFAPTDEAFAKLPAGTVEALLQDKDRLTSILTYHVVPGKVMAADVVGLTSAPTVNGQEATIKVDGNTVMVDNATITSTDIDASNGVIHVIDTVLLPM